MMGIADLPALNASLNAVSAIFLLLGYFFIRTKQVNRHRAAMLAAFFTSVLFLASYLVYHYHVGSKPFPGQGWIRSVYFAILISHVVLAAAIGPLAIATLTLAWRERFQTHRRLARWTLPLWLYVSLTGIVVYLMIYQIYG